MPKAILLPRPSVLFVLCMLLAGIILPSRTTLAVNFVETTISNEDWRPEQVGVWNCKGVSTLEGAESPYYGHLKNEWSPDGLTLILRFSEYHPFGQPFREEQRWSFVETTGTHSRAITTNDGSAAVLAAQGPQENVMQWEGSFVTSQGAALQFSETVKRISAEEYYWHGTITLGTDEIGYYALTCTKVNN